MIIRINHLFEIPRFIINGNTDIAPKRLPLLTKEFILTVTGCEGSNNFPDASFRLREPPSLNISCGEVSSSPRSISGYFPLLG